MPVFRNEDFESNSCIQCAAGLPVFSYYASIRALVEDQECMLFSLGHSSVQDGAFKCPHYCDTGSAGLQLTLPLPDPGSVLAGQNLCAYAIKFAWERDVDVFLRNVLV